MVARFCLIHGATAENVVLARSLIKLLPPSLSEDLRINAL